MKIRFKKILTLTLSLVLAASIMTPAFAAEGGAEQTSPVKLTAQPIVFNVTVPNRLPVDVDSKGEVTVATNVQIENHSAAPITITGVQVNPITDWNIVAINKDFHGTRIGTKEFGFILNSDEVSTNGTVALTKANWPSINGNSSFPLTYGSVVAPQKDAINSNKIADVVFTIGWDAVEPEASPEIGSKYTDSNYEYSYGQDYYSSWENSDLNGWGVKIIDNTQTSYIQPLETIQGQPVVSYRALFDNYHNTSLTLEGTWTNKNVTDMSYMFTYSQATVLDLSSFDTSNVTDMNNMFNESKATTLDLSGFDTSKVTDMNNMFAYSQATVLDLSSFNTYNVTNMKYMFLGCRATTGYARIQEEANKFNATYMKPDTLTFRTK